MKTTSQQDIVKLKDDPIDPKLILYFIIGTLIYVCLSFPIAYFASSDIFSYLNTESDLFTRIYYRYYVNTTYISFGQFFYYVTMWVVGFTFVNVVTLQNKRGNPFKDRDGTYSSFKKACLFSVCFYFLCGIVVLRQKEDLSNNCQSQNGSSYSQMILQQQLIHDAVNDLHEKPIISLFASIDQMNYLGQNDSPGCHIYTTKETFNFNYYVWTLAYFLGLQWSHLNNGILSDITLDWSVMKDWPWYLWLIFVGILILFACILAYLCFVYAFIGYLTTYQYIVIGIITIMVSLTAYYNKQGYNLHIHHYFIGMFFMVVTCYQNTFIAILNAFFNGMSIEGGCYWGYDPLWEKSTSNDRVNQVLQHQAQSKVRYHNYQATLAKEVIANVANVKVNDESSQGLISQPIIKDTPVVLQEQQQPQFKYEYFNFDSMHSQSSIDSVNQNGTIKTSSEMV